MSLKTGLVLFAFVLVQVLAENAEVDFIENVISKDTRDHRIVSGWEARPGQLPYQTSLRMVGSNGDVSSCGGSIIARQWMLTAAHCTAGRITLVIRAGVTNLTKPEYLGETNLWYNHPTYNDLFPNVVQPDDISIVNLRRPVTYTPLLQPIRVQSRADAFRNYDTEVVQASGFGRTWTNGVTPEVLNWVYLRATSNEGCGRVFGTNLITNNAICAGFFNVTSQSTCQGDSGGPLVHVGSDGVPTLIGVTSFVAGGNFGCHSGLPAGFIRTGPFQDWFTQITHLDFDNLEEEDEPTEPPTTEPPTTQPPTTQPPTTQPPTTQPPTTQPPTTQPPTTQPPTTEPPTTQPPTTQPPTTQPPTTQPPTTQPPTEPPTTQPPTNQPPTEPPTTQPPTTQPPTEPPTTQPPTTEPPTTEPETEAPETEEDSDESDEDSSEEKDSELADLLKRLEVKVKVKVQMNKFIKKKKVHHIKEIRG